MPATKQCNFISEVNLCRKLRSEGKLFADYPTDGIVVKISSRKLQLIKEKSYGVYPYWQM